MHPFYFFQGHLCHCFLSSWKQGEVVFSPCPSSRGPITASLQGKRGGEIKIKALVWVSSWLPSQVGCNRMVQPALPQLLGMAVPAPDCGAGSPRSPRERRGWSGDLAPRKGRDHGAAMAGRAAGSLAAPLPALPAGSCRGGLFWWCWFSRPPCAALKETHTNRRGSCDAETSASGQRTSEKIVKLPVFGRVLVNSETKAVALNAH